MTTTATTTKTQTASTKPARRKTPAPPVTGVTSEEICAGVRDQAAIETDVDATTADMTLPATDTVVDESSPAAVEDTLAIPPIAQTVVDEAPAIPPADVTFDVADLAACIAMGDADVATKVQYVTGIVRQGDAAIAAAIEAGMIRIGPAARPARKTGTSTGNKSVPVVCAHCDKHFLGRANQVECRVCSDYMKTHGTPRPLTGSTAGTVTQAAAKTVTAGTKKGRKQVSTHRPH